ncbi:MAG TPA: ATP-binding cassette domain-containing protein [Burkholderiaceae bacterium]|nr:ATP-binding cassette domain-containing protein [Burkholderiaceae bacterium]
MPHTRPESHHSTAMTPETNQPVLEIRSLTKHYGGVKALTDAHFRLMPGEHVAIVGDNGAGKSTFVRLITGAEQPNSGDLLLDGQTVSFKSPLDARDQGMETVYQTLALAEDLDVPANIFLGREITHINLGPLSVLNHKAMREQSTDMLATTGVKIQDMSESLRGMSGGQRQCVAIARAAGFAKKLIILDEPTAALGVAETARVEQIITGLKARGIPLIIISHNLRQVFDLADRIYVFRQGRIICNRLTSETNPQEIVGLITGAINPESLNPANSVPDASNSNQREAETV